MPQKTDLTPNNFVIDTLRSWLGDIPSSRAEFSDDKTPAILKTKAILNDILPKVGLTEPYTAEQCTINALLLSKQADKRICQAAWEFYIDYNNPSSSDQAKPFAA